MSLVNSALIYLVTIIQYIATSRAWLLNLYYFKKFENHLLSYTTHISNVSSFCVASNSVLEADTECFHYCRKFHLMVFYIIATNALNEYSCNVEVTTH